MVTNLIRQKNEWFVTQGDSIRVLFNTIELAADFMVTELSVVDDDIDKALYDMAVNQHNKASFSSDGKFSHSELA